MNKKFILDACCGGRMMWFTKNHPNAIYIDNRVLEKGTFVKNYNPNFEVKPDKVMDFRKMDFPDKSFKLVVFDPPHIKRLKETSILAKKFGVLNAETWQSDIKKGFEECWRVLEDYGTLIFKWSEEDVTVKEVLRVIKIRPLFGHTERTKNKTKWMCFLKIPKEVIGIPPKPKGEGILPTLL